MQYDYLIIASGLLPSSASPVLPKPPKPSSSSAANTKLADSVLPFATLQDALRLRRKILQLKSLKKDLNVVVVGGGYSGIELSTNLKEKLQDGGSRKVSVKLVHRGRYILPRSSSEFNKKVARKELDVKGVEVLTLTDVGGQFMFFVHF